MADSLKRSIERVAAWRASSLAFVKDNFGAVPDAWQLDALAAWDRGDQRIAFAASKGPGKTALLSWLIWHFLSTRRQSKVAATSISGDNLQDCLWAELAKWQSRSAFLMAAFEWQKTRIVARDKPEMHFASARKWSREADTTAQADTLAGLHADYMLFVIDEAGGVPDAVAVSAEAALATGHETRMLIAGNTTQCEGPLWRACGSEKHLWTVIHINGDPDNPKRSPRISVQWAKEMIAKYGRDNPWVMANVLGEFPPTSSLVFIPQQLFDEAARRPAQSSVYDAFLIGVDVARFGNDESVIRFRKGLDARTWPAQKYRNIDTMDLASRVAQYANEFSADGVFIDGGGVGGGVIDRCRQLKVRNIFEVQFGGKSDRVKFGESTMTYDNKAAEIWGAGREWLRYGAIDNDPAMKRQMTNRRFFYNQRYGREALALESKEDMMKRGLESPNDPDALFLTFAYPVNPSRDSGGIVRPGGARAQLQWDYDPLEGMNESA